MAWSLRSTCWRWSRSTGSSHRGDFSEESGAPVGRKSGSRVGVLVMSDMAPNMSGCPGDQARVMHLAELGLEFSRAHLKTDGAFSGQSFSRADYEAFEAMRAETSRLSWCGNRMPSRPWCGALSARSNIALKSLFRMLFYRNTRRCRRNCLNNMFKKSRDLAGHRHGADDRIQPVQFNRQVDRCCHEYSQFIEEVKQPDLEVVIEGAPEGDDDRRASALPRTRPDLGWFRSAEKMASRSGQAGRRTLFPDECSSAGSRCCC